MDHTDNSTKPMEEYAQEDLSANTEGTLSEAGEEDLSANTEGTLSEAGEETLSLNTDETASAAEQEEGDVPDDILVAAMEAILFAMGEAVSLDLLAQALRISVERTETIAGLLAARCAGPASGLVLNRYEDAIQLSTKPELLEYLIRIASQPKKPRLTPTLMETLSIIAYRQPVTRGEIERIRGVSSDHAVGKLIEYGLIKELGRLDAPGRPMLFGTTDEFLRRFGMDSKESLPPIDPVAEEDFKAEAESEIPVVI